jgi:hypothetical protein
MNIVEPPAFSMVRVAAAFVAEADANIPELLPL